MRRHMLGRLKDKANCEIHVFRDIKTASGKPARKKVCHKRKVSAEGAAAWRASLKKHACKSPKLPDSLRAWCGVKAKRKSAKRAQLALPGMR
jgi:hypothetical protein